MVSKAADDIEISLKSRMDSGNSYSSVVVNKDKKEISVFALKLKGAQPVLKES